MRRFRSKKTNNLQVATLGSFALVVGLVACSAGGSSDTGATAPGESGAQSLTILQGAEPQCLDPYVSTLTHTGNIARHLYDQLAIVGRDLTVKPFLATEWQSVTESSWEIKIHTDGKFSNGDSVTPEDVVASITYAKESNAANWFRSWQSAEATGPDTLVINTDGPDPALPNTLTRLYVMPASILESDPSTLCNEPIGSGPYELEAWQVGQEIILTKRAEHFIDPKIEHVVFKAVPEGAARISMLISGEADLIANVPVDSIEQIEENPETKIISAPGIRQVLNFVDTRQAPLDNRDVRLALNHAVDMETIIKEIIGGYADLNISIRSPNSPYAATDLAPYDYDPEKAKKLLEKAGYADGFTLEFNYPKGRWLKDSEVAEAISTYFEAIGIRTNLKTTQYETFFNEWANGQYTGLAMIGTIDGDGNPGSTDRAFLDSRGPWAHSWNSEEYDALIDESATELDEQRRTELLQEMDRIIYEEAILCCGYVQNEIFGAKTDLHYEVHPGEAIIAWDAYWEK